MKKLAVLAAVVVMAAVAAPAFSATNPFMDVPMNHWAYDAIGQLAAHGILSGYPDGTYKGKQPTTRYEMASALARALAVVDMTKASKQDVEMLKRLVVEFKDELEALGVRVDELDERVAVLENRLGGWHIHGVLALDVENQSSNNALRNRKSDGKVKLDEARLFFERTWGENDEYFFRARLRNEGDGNSGNADKDGTAAYFDRFYVEMPFFFDSKMTLGRFSWNWEGDYMISLPATGSWTGDTVMTDWTWTGLGLTKNFGLGTVNAVFAHPDKFYKDWMIMLNGSFQFTEQFGLDLGAQALLGDNNDEPGLIWDDKEHKFGYAPTHQEGDLAFNKLWTLFGGLHFNFNENIALKGIFYYQKVDTEQVQGGKWVSMGYGLGDDTDNANHWAAIIDVKQEALKYTSLWLEYGQYKKGFITRSDTSLFYSDFLAGLFNTNTWGGLDTDVKYWRVALGQEWNEKWATHLFYYGYDVDDINGKSVKPKEFGLGVQYKLNDYTTMGLNYIHADSDQDLEEDKDNVIRFRTKVVF